MGQNDPTKRAMVVAAESVKIQANNLAALQRIEARQDDIIDRIEAVQKLIDQKSSVPDLAREFRAALCEAMPQLVEKFLVDLMAAHVNFIESENVALRQVAHDIGEWMAKTQSDSLGAYDNLGLILSSARDNSDIGDKVSQLDGTIKMLTMQLQYLKLGAMT